VFGWCRRGGIECIVRRVIIWPPLVVFLVIGEMLSFCISTERHIGKRLVNMLYIYI